MPPWAWYSLFGLAVGLIASFVLDHLLGVWRKRYLPPPSTTVFFAGDRHGERSLLATVDAARTELVLVSRTMPTGELLASLNKLSERGVKVRAIVGQAPRGLISRFVVALTPQDVAEEWIVVDRQCLVRGAISHDTEGLEDRLILRGKPDLALAYASQFESWLCECEAIALPAPIVAVA
jgi:phosphatidylserine/phosphatidylglycerophosphate/cardiolipin synthase-like enzyme